MSTPDDGAAPRSREGELQKTPLLATIGLVAGVVGLTALAFGIVLYALDPASFSIVVLNSIGGLTGILFYAITNMASIRRVASGRSTPLILLEILLVAGLFLAVGAANFVAHASKLEWDLTKDKLFSLQEQSLDVVKRLKGPIKVIGLYKTNDAARQALTDLVELYQLHSPAIRLEQVNIDTLPPNLARQYKLQAGGPRIIVAQDVENGRYTKLKNATEQELTRALIELTDRPPRKVYLLTGHGEASLEDPKEEGSYQRALTALNDEGYTAEPLSLVDKDAVPADATVVVLAGPKKSLLQNELDALDKYLAQGGRFAALIDPGVVTGLEPVLKKNGAELGDDLVVDPNPASRASGFGSEAPVVKTFEEHPIMNALRGTALLFWQPRSVSPGLVEGVSVATLLRTSPDSWGETHYQSGEAQRGLDDLLGPVPLAVASTRRTSAVPGKRTDEMRMVVVGDSNFASARFWPTAGNGDFFLNITSWLSGGEAEITIRPRMRGATHVSMTVRELYGVIFVSVNLVPLVIVGFGFSVWAVRRRK
ncbi:MAG: Gldg family protein [Myxococcota bacterium]